MNYYKSYVFYLYDKEVKLENFIENFKYNDDCVILIKEGKNNFSCIKFYDLKKSKSLPLKTYCIEDIVKQLYESVK